MDPSANINKVRFSESAVPMDNHRITRSSNNEFPRTSNHDNQNAYVVNATPKKVESINNLHQIPEYLTKNRKIPTPRLSNKPIHPCRKPNQQNDDASDNLKPTAAQFPTYGLNLPPHGLSNTSNQQSQSKCVGSPKDRGSLHIEQHVFPIPHEELAAHPHNTRGYTNTANLANQSVHAANHQSLVASNCLTKIEDHVLPEQPASSCHTTIGSIKTWTQDSQTVEKVNRSYQVLNASNDVSVPLQETHGFDNKSNSQNRDECAANPCNQRLNRCTIKEKVAQNIGTTLQEQQKPFHHNSRELFNRSNRTQAQSVPAAKPNNQHVDASNNLTQSSIHSSRIHEAVTNNQSLVEHVSSSHYQNHGLDTAHSTLKALNASNNLSKTVFQESCEQCAVSLHNTHAVRVVTAQQRRYQNTYAANPTHQHLNLTKTADRIQREEHASYVHENIGLVKTSHPPSQIADAVNPCHRSSDALNTRRSSLSQTIIRSPPKQLAASQHYKRFGLLNRAAHQSQITYAANQSLNVPDKSLGTVNPSQCAESGDTPRETLGLLIASSLQSKHTQATNPGQQNVDYSNDIFHKEVTDTVKQHGASNQHCVDFGKSNGLPHSSILQDQKAQVKNSSCKCSHISNHLDQNEHMQNPLSESAQRTKRLGRTLLASCPQNESASSVLGQVVGAIDTITVPSSRKTDNSLGGDCCSEDQSIEVSGCDFVGSPDCNRHCIYGKKVTFKFKSKKEKEEKGRYGRGKRMEKEETEEDETGDEIEDDQWDVEEEDKTESEENEEDEEKEVKEESEEESEQSNPISCTSHFLNVYYYVDAPYPMDQGRLLQYFHHSPAAPISETLHSITNRGSSNPLNWLSTPVHERMNDLTSIATNHVALGAISGPIVPHEVNSLSPNPVISVVKESPMYASIPLTTNTMDPYTYAANPLAAKTIEPYKNAANPLALNTVDPLALNTVDPFKNAANPLASNTMNPYMNAANPLVSNTLDPYTNAANPLVSNTLDPYTNAANPLAISPVDPYSSAANPLESNNVNLPFSAHDLTTESSAVRPHSANSIHFGDLSLPDTRSVYASRSFTLNNADRPKPASKVLNYQGLDLHLDAPNSLPLRRDESPMYTSSRLALDSENRLVRLSILKPPNTMEGSSCVPSTVIPLTHSTNSDVPSMLNTVDPGTYLTNPAEPNVLTKTIPLTSSTNPAAVNGLNTTDPRTYSMNPSMPNVLNTTDPRTYLTNPAVPNVLNTTDPVTYSTNSPVPNVLNTTDPSTYSTNPAVPNVLNTTDPVTYSTNSPVPNVLNTTDPRTYSKNPAVPNVLNTTDPCTYSTNPAVANVLNKAGPLTYSTIQAIPNVEDQAVYSLNTLPPQAMDQYLNAPNPIKESKDMSNDLYEFCRIPHSLHQTSNSLNYGANSRNWKTDNSTTHLVSSCGPVYTAKNTEWTNVHVHPPYFRKYLQDAECQTVRPVVIVHEEDEDDGEESDDVYDDDDKDGGDDGDKYDDFSSDDNDRDNKKLAKEKEEKKKRSMKEEWNKTKESDEDQLKERAKDDKEPADERSGTEICISNQHFTAVVTVFQ